jgi:hypothetical protein
MIVINESYRCFLKSRKAGCTWMGIEIVHLSAVGLTILGGQLVAPPSIAHARKGERNLTRMRSAVHVMNLEPLLNS